MKKKFYTNQLFIYILLIITSCTPLSKITYLNESDYSSEWDVSPIPTPHYLEIGDILVVKILSLDENMTNFFNVDNNVNSSNDNITAANIYLNGFTINQDGFIEIPYIGDVLVVNKTIEEAKKSIKLEVDKYFKQATVIVKLGNFNITVLGEVNRPNTYPIYKDNISILEAIAISGGITDYGDLSKIKLLRSSNNQKKTHKINLTKKDIIHSEYYYLKNNDLIYVEPLAYKSIMKSQSQLLLSAITTAAVIINLYLKVTE